MHENLEDMAEKKKNIKIRLEEVPLKKDQKE